MYNPRETCNQVTLSKDTSKPPLKEQRVWDYTVHLESFKRETQGKLMPRLILLNPRYFIM